jgi:hypothetical protein
MEKMLKKDDQKTFSVAILNALRAFVPCPRFTLEMQPTTSDLGCQALIPETATLNRKPYTPELRTRNLEPNTGT